MNLLELLSVVEIDAARGRKSKKPAKPSLQKKFNKPVTDVEPTAEALAQVAKNGLTYRAASCYKNNALFRVNNKKK